MKSGKAIKAIGILILLWVQISPLRAELTSGFYAAIEKKDYKTALGKLDVILKKHPRNKEAKLWRAKILSWTEQYDASEADFAALVSWYPDNRDIRLGFARVLNWHGKYDKALTQYDIYLEKSPRDLEARSERAYVLGRLGRHAEAEAACRELLVHRPRDKALLEGLADALSQQGKFEEAAEIFGRLADAEPGEIRYRERLAQCFGSLKDHLPDAEAQYLAIIEKKPDHYGAWFGLGQVREWSGDYEGAKAAYLSAAALAGDRSETTDALERINAALESAAFAELTAGFYSAVEKKDHKTALEKLDIILTKDPGNMEFKLWRAKILSWTGQYSASEADFTEIISLYPDNKDARLGFAKVLNWDKKYADALPQYDAYLAKNPDDLEARSERAYILGRLGRHAEAEAAFRELLIRQPRDKALLEGLADALSQQGKFEEAAEIFGKLIDAEPDEIQYRERLAQCFVSLKGRLADAEAQYLAIIEKKPDHYGAWFGLGQAREWSGNYRGAKTAYMRAAALAGDRSEAAAALDTMNRFLASTIESVVMFSRDSDETETWTMTETARISFPGGIVVVTAKDVRMENALASYSVYSAGLGLELPVSPSFSAEAALAYYNASDLNDSSVEWRLGGRYSLKTAGLKNRNAGLVLSLSAFHAPIIQKPETIFNRITADGWEGILSGETASWFASMSGSAKRCNDGNRSRGWGINTGWRSPGRKWSLAYSFQYARFHEDMNHGYWDPMPWRKHGLILNAETRLGRNVKGMVSGEIMRHREALADWDTGHYLRIDIEYAPAGKDGYLRLGWHTSDSGMSRADAYSARGADILWRIRL